MHLMSSSCTNQAKVEGGVDSMNLRFDKPELEDTPSKENRQVVATLYLPPTVNLQDLELRMQVQVAPMKQDNKSKVVCKSAKGIKLKEIKGHKHDPMTSLYKFLSNSPKSPNNQPLQVKFIFQFEPVGASTMKAQFTLLHNSKPTGTPSTVIWKACPKIELLDIMDEQEIKYGEIVMVGLKNVGDRIIHPSDITIHLSNKDKLRLLNNKGQTIVANRASLTEFLKEEDQNKLIHPHEKVQLGLQLQPVNDQQFPKAQLQVLYEQTVVATNSIKLVDKYTKKLEVTMPAKDGTVLKGNGPFEIVIKNTGYPIDLSEVGVKVNTSIEFFLNNLSMRNSEEDTLARFCKPNMLKKGEEVSLQLALQPGTFPSLQIDIVLYELRKPANILVHRKLTWQPQRFIQAQVSPIEGSFKVEDSQLLLRAQLINTGTQRIQLSKKNLSLFIEDFVPIANTGTPQLTLRYPSNGPAHKGYIDPLESVTLVLELKSDQVDAFSKVDFISATITFYYYIDNQEKKYNGPLGTIKVAWKRKQ
jgi:hypothetical protein